MNFYVYEYIDPVTNLPFYIGKGTGNRMFVHLKESLESTGNKRKTKHILNLQAQGLEPIVRKVQEDMTEDSAYDLEMQLIQKYGRKGLDPNGILLNYCIDNRPPHRYGKDHHQYSKPIITEHTEETKRKISLAHKGRPSWHKGRTRSDEFKQKTSIIQRGKRVSEETRKKIRAATTGAGNHNYGTMWITDGTNNTKLNAVDTIPEGWYKGRTITRRDPHVRCQ